MKEDLFFIIELTLINAVAFITNRHPLANFIKDYYKMLILYIN
jgi:hypothetical protein